MTGTEDTSEEDPRHAGYKFRNYVPRSEKLKKYQLPKPNHQEIEQKIDAQIKEVLESAAQQPVLSSVLPKRTNWDLKRDVDKKLQTLSHKTDKVIYELVRKKIQESESATLDDDVSQEVYLNVIEPEAPTETRKTKVSASDVAVFDALEKFGEHGASDESDED